MSQSKIKHKKQSIESNQKHDHYLQSCFPQLQSNTFLLKNNPQLATLYHKFVDINNEIHINLDNHALGIMKQKMFKKWNAKDIQQLKSIQDKAEALNAQKEIQKRMKKYAKKRKYMNFHMHQQNNQTYLETYRKYLQETVKDKTLQTEQNQDNSQSLSKTIQKQKYWLKSSKMETINTTISKTQRKKQQYPMSSNTYRKKQNQDNSQQLKLRLKTHNNSIKKSYFMTSPTNHNQQDQQKGSLFNQNSSALPIGIPKQRLEMLKNHPMIISYTIDKIKQSKIKTESNLSLNSLMNHKKNDIKNRRELTVTSTKNNTLVSNNNNQIQKERQLFYESKNNFERLNIIKNRLQKIYSCSKKLDTGRNSRMAAMRRKMQKQMKKQYKQKMQIKSMRQIQYDTEAEIQNSAFTRLNKIERSYLKDKLKHIGVKIKSQQKRTNLSLLK